MKKLMDANLNAVCMDLLFHDHSNSCKQLRKLYPSGATVILYTHVLKHACFYGNTFWLMKALGIEYIFSHADALQKCSGWKCLANQTAIPMVWSADVNNTSVEICAAVECGGSISESQMSSQDINEISSVARDLLCAKYIIFDYVILSP